MHYHISGNIACEDLETLGIIITQIIPNSGFRVKTKGEELIISGSDIDMEIYGEGNGNFLIGGSITLPKLQSKLYFTQISEKLKALGWRDFRFFIQEVDEIGNFVGIAVEVSR